MKLKEICLLKDGDTVYVQNVKKTVKQPAHNDTIKVGNKYRYFSEITKERVETRNSYTTSFQNTSYFSEK